MTKSEALGRVEAAADELKKTMLNCITDLDTTHKVKQAELQSQLDGENEAIGSHWAAEKFADCNTLEDFKAAYRETLNLSFNHTATLGL